jgi:hypothetical protein
MERDISLGIFLAARRVRMHQRQKAVVGVGGGEPGSSAKEGRSLDDYQPYGCRALGTSHVDVGARHDAKHAGSRSMVAEVLGIDSRCNNPIRRVPT